MALARNGIDAVREGSRRGIRRVGNTRSVVATLECASISARRTMSAPVSEAGRLFLGMFAKQSADGSHPLSQGALPYGWILGGADQDETVVPAPR